MPLLLQPPSFLPLLLYSLAVRLAVCCGLLLSTDNAPSPSRRAANGQPAPAHVHAGCLAPAVGTTLLKPPFPLPPPPFSYDSTTAKDHFRGARTMAPPAWHIHVCMLVSAAVAQGTARNATAVGLALLISRRIASLRRHLQPPIYPRSSVIRSKLLTGRAPRRSCSSSNRPGPAWIAGG